MNKVTSAASYLRHWMTTVMRENDWNAQEWASKAGTSPTNITRFLKGSDHIPSYQTLVKLAAVAGIPIPTPGVVQRQVPAVRIPLLKWDHVALGRAKLPALLRASKEHIVADWHGLDAFAVRLDNDRFHRIGYMTGDILVIDPSVAPVAGKHVLVVSPTGEDSGPVIYQPPHIFCSIEQIQVKIEQVTVIGTVVELIRRMV